MISPTQELDNMENKASEETNETSMLEGLKEGIATVRQKICRTMVNRPILCCLGNWSVAFILAIAVFLGGFFEFADFGINDFVVITEQDVQNFLALTSAEDLDVPETEISDEQVRFRNQDLFNTGVNFMFEAHKGNKLLSRENMQEICEIERLVVSQKSYPLYCATEDNQGIDTICKPQFLSLTSLFYGNETDFSCELKTVEEEQEILDSITTNPELVSFFFDDPVNPTVIRSIIFFGGPLGEDSPPNKNFTETTEEITDAESEQTLKGYNKLIEEYQDSLFDYFGVRNGALKPAYDRDSFRKSGSGLDVKTGGALIETFHSDQIITTDMVLSVGAFAIVLVLISVYMRTCCFGSLSMLAILLSIPLGLFIFAVILQFDYFTPLAILVLFLIAGIGADNVLVLFDAWKQSASEIVLSEEEDYNELLFKRLDYAYSRAVMSVMHTASTTFIAFISTSVTPIDAVGGLGLYAAFVVLVNFCYMFCIHPANLMFYHRLFLRNKEREAHAAALLETAATDKVEEGGKKSSEKIQLGDGRKAEEDMNILDKIFEQYIFVINETWCAFIAVPIAIGFGIMMLVFTSKLQTPSELESNFNEGHMFFDFTSDFNNLFVGGTDNSFTQVDGVFGIADLDISDIPGYSGEQVQGDPIFDDNFEIFSKESQDFIIEVCSELEALPCNEGACSDGTLIKGGTVTCTMQLFREFVETEKGTSSFVDPIGGIESEEDFIDIMEEFLSGPGISIREKVGIIDGEIKFLSLEYRMTMKQNQPLTVKQPVIDLFDAFDADVRSRAPLALKSFYQTSFDHVWQHTEEAFVSGLFSGIGISLAASSVVLFIGTKSLAVSFMAILGVGTVVVSVLGTIERMGWELGTAESIAGVFVIGLAVDYIVHLGHMFMHSRKFLQGHKNENSPEDYNVITRFMFYSGAISYYNDEMIAFSVRKMGGTVLAGAATTFCSAAVLSLCNLAFFSKMSILLMLTIFYAGTYAFAFFVPALKLFGPGDRRNKFSLCGLFK